MVTVWRFLVRRCVLWLGIAWIASAAPEASAQVADTAVVRLGRPSSGTEAFIAWPAGKGPFPAVVIVHDERGLDESMRDVARRLAREGYAAIVPDLAHGQSGSEAQRALALSRGLGQERAVADLAATVALLRADPRVGRKKIGLIGFSMGAGLAQRFATSSSEVAAVVIFHGPAITEPGRWAGLKARLQAHFGQNDRDKVETLRQGLRRSGKSGEVFVYTGADQAFMNDEHPSFHPDAARQAWARTLAFLQRHVRR
jgi:carboxymethylenebutenolidase